MHTNKASVAKHNGLLESTQISKVHTQQVTLQNKKLMAKFNIPYTK